MEVPESPLSLCQHWLDQAHPTVSPPSLTGVCLRRIQSLVRLYSTSSDDSLKTSLRRSLRGLFDVPGHFVPLLLETLLNCLDQSPASSASDQSPMDLFLLSQVIHPQIVQLDLQLIPTSMRNYVIRNMTRMSGLRTLSLCLSLNIPWSSFFSPVQTVRLTSALAGLRVLAFQDLADDEFLSEVGHHCLDLLHLDVQGSVQVTDAGLASLSPLARLKYLDVNRTSVSAEMLAEVVRTNPTILSLGSWEEFSDFDEEILQNLTELSSANFSLTTDMKVTSCAGLTKLKLRMTNSSDKIHSLGSLRSLQSLAIADLDYRQSNLGVGLLGLAGSLRELFLDHVFDWDTNHLRAIGLHCQELDHFTISNCTISATNIQPEQEKKTKYFRKLSRLLISSNISHSQFLVLTGHAYNLTSLQTGINCWVTTRLLSHLVKLNSLSRLSFLRIDNTKDLSINVLFLILMKARHLKKIVGVESWKNMDEKLCSQINSLFLKKNLPHNLVPFNSLGS